MQTSVKKIRPSDFELSQVQDNLAEAIQQLLDLVNKPGSGQMELSPLLQRLRGPGTPQSVKTPALRIHGDPSKSGVDTVTIGDPATATASAIGAQIGITGALTLTGPLSMIGILSVIGQLLMTGNSVFRPTSAQGVVVVPVDTGVGFAVRNPANTGNVFSVSGAGVALSSSFSSDRGFKTVISCGKYWNSAYPANIAVQTYEAVVNGSGGGNGTTPFIYRWSHPGSVVGMSLNQAGPISGVNYLAVYKNGAVAYTWTAGAGSYNTSFTTSFNKAAIPFAANDVMTVFHSNSAAGNTQITAYLTLEMAA